MIDDIFLRNYRSKLQTEYKEMYSYKSHFDSQLKNFGFVIKLLN